MSNGHEQNIGFENEESGLLAKLYQLKPSKNTIFYIANQD